MTTTENTAIAIVVPEKDQLPPSLLTNIEAGFKSAFEQAEKWRTQALAIQVTGLDQKAEMKLARTIRLELKNVRVNADKARKALKADALLMGRAIDGVYNLLEAAIVPMERHLDEQEKYAERLAEAERMRLKAEREAALSPFLDITMTMALPDLSSMTAEQWEGYLADAKLLHNAKIEQAQRAEAERIAAEQAAAAERERQRIELERLRKEAVEREAAAKAEREAAEKAQREAAAKAKAERDALEAAAKAEREAAERKLEAQKAAAEYAQRVADEAARKERAAIQAKADEDARRLAALSEQQKKEDYARHVDAQRKHEAKLKAAEADRKAAQAATDAANAAREKLEREVAAKNAAEAARLKAELAAQSKANRAPDKQKAITFAATVRTLKTPEATTAEGKAVMAEIAQKVENFAKWIETQASNL